MQKLLIYRKDHEIKEHEISLNETLPILQKVVDEYNKLGIKALLTIQMLLELESQSRHRHAGNKATMDAVAEYLKSLIVNDANDSKIGGFPISKDQLKKMVELPDITGFVDALNNVIVTSTIGGTSNDISMGSFDIIDDKAVINKRQLESFINSRTAYAETKGEIECAKIVIALCDALNTHHKAFKLQRMDAIDDPPWGIKLGDNGYEPDMNDIRRFGPSFE